MNRLFFFTLVCNYIKLYKTEEPKKAQLRYSKIICKTLSALSLLSRKNGQEGLLQIISNKIRRDDFHLTDESFDNMSHCT